MIFKQWVRFLSLSLRVLFLTSVSEANPDTQAFAASYNSGLKDDDENEFAYMGRDSSADDVLQVQQELTDERKHDSENEDMYEPVDEEYDEEEEEREHVETISRRQLDREVAAAVREKVG